MTDRKHYADSLISSGKLLIFGLLSLVLASVIYGISILARDLVFGRFFLVSIIALFLTWLLERFQWKGQTAGLALFFLGSVLILGWIGDLGEIIMKITSGFSHWVSQPVFRPTDAWAGIDLLLPSIEEFQVRMIILFTELRVWLISIFSGSPVYSYQAVSIVWGIVIWLASAWAGWFLSRRKMPLVSILPAGLILGITLGYTYGPTSILVPFLIASLLLVAVVPSLNREQDWKDRRMDFPQDQRRQSFIFTLGLTVVVVCGAAFLPNIPVRFVIDQFRVWANPEFERADPILESLGLAQPASELGEMTALIDGGLPRSFLIGAGSELSEQVVMTVHVQDKERVETLRNAGVPFYWRSVTYDRYTGSGWASSAVTIRSYQSAELAIQDENPKLHLLQQDFRFIQPNDFIYAAGEIVSLDTDYQIAWRDFPDLEADVIMPGDFFAGSQNRTAYRVSSLVPLVTENQLRTAPAIYPVWVAARYLRMPDDLSDRVIDLARRLTWNAPTAYDKARSIERYLRGYEYELNLPAPPQNRDLVDYFLFELQKGYCDYYATAMVLLARSVGVPARLVVGYTSGSYDPIRQQFTVTEENAHSWVEVYFSGIGWVPFEPTAAQDEMILPSRGIAQPMEADQPSESEVHDSVGWGFPSNGWFWLGCVLLMFVVVPILWFTVDGWYLRLLPFSRVVRKLYRRLYRHGARLDSPARRQDTPSEFAAKLKTRIGHMTQQSRWSPDPSSLKEDMDYLTLNYVQSVFSPTSPEPGDVGAMVAVWLRLRRNLVFLELLAIAQKYRAGRWVLSASSEKVNLEKF